MTSKMLNRIGNFLKYHKNSILFFGYSINGLECFYIRKGDKFITIPFSSEFICEHGNTTAWNKLKTYLGNSNTIAYDAKTDLILSKGE